MSKRTLTITLQPDWKGVHDDVQELLELGLVELGEGGGVVCPLCDGAHRHGVASGGVTPRPWGARN